MDDSSERSLKSPTHGTATWDRLGPNRTIRTKSGYLHPLGEAVQRLMEIETDAVSVGMVPDALGLTALEPEAIPYTPRRDGVHFLRWQTIWLYAKEHVDRGATLAAIQVNIAEQLADQTPSEQTLSKIIKAGKAGELD